MSALREAENYQQDIESWYRDHYQHVQRIIGRIIRRKGTHGEDYDEMRAELNYTIFKHVESATRRGTMDKFVLSMAIEYAYRRWASGRRSYHNRKGRHDLHEEKKAQCYGDEWQFPLSRRLDNPAVRARFHLDMVTIGGWLTPKARRVLREFIKDPYASDKAVSEALGKGWRHQDVFFFRQMIKRTLMEAGYTPPPQRREQAPPEIHAIGQKAVGIYGACQRTPKASYADIARRLGCERSHVCNMMHRFLVSGIPWVKDFIENNARKKIQQPRNEEMSPEYE